MYDSRVGPYRPHSKSLMPHGKGVKSLFFLFENKNTPCPRQHLAVSPFTLASSILPLAFFQSWPPPPGAKIEPQAQVATLACLGLFEQPA